MLHFRKLNSSYIILKLKYNVLILTNTIQNVIDKAVILCLFYPLLFFTVEIHIFGIHFQEKDWKDLRIYASFSLPAIFYQLLDINFPYQHVQK